MAVHHPVGDVTLAPSTFYSTVYEFYTNASSDTNMSTDAVKPPQTAAAPSLSDLESRWPRGEKETRYRKAKLEEFAPYVRSDGLVTRLTTYKDPDCEC